MKKCLDPRKSVKYGRNAKGDPKAGGEHDALISGGLMRALAGCRPSVRQTRRCVAFPALPPSAVADLLLRRTGAALHEGGSRRDAEARRSKATVRVTKPVSSGGYGHVTRLNPKHEATDQVLVGLPRVVSEGVDRQIKC